MSMRAHTDEGPQVSKYTWYGVISTEKKGVKRKGERRQFRESKVSCRGRRGGKKRGRALRRSLLKTCAETSSVRVPPGCKGRP